MKIPFTAFRGEIPSIGNSKLPEGFATSAINTKLTPVDLQSFWDIGNPFTLSKSAPIIAEFLLKDKWLQWSSSELTYGSMINVSLGIIPGDTTYRTFISGTLTGLRQTNYFYATDPSQQGVNVLGAYPYVTFPVGIANPTSAPTVVPSATAGTTTAYQYAQEVTVNNAIVAAAGTGYTAGDKPFVSGGTLSNALTGAQVEVTTVDGSGAVTGLSLVDGGFYQAGGAPTSPASTTGGTGTGLTLNLSTVTQSFNGLSPQNYNNGAGSFTTWSVAGNTLQVSSGQGNLTVAYTTAAFSLTSAGSIVMQCDARAVDNGGGEYPDIVMFLPGTPIGVTDEGNFRLLSGGGVILSKIDSKLYLFYNMGENDGNLPSGTIVQSVPITVTGGTFYRFHITLKAQTASSIQGYSVTATVATQAAPTTILATVTGFVPYKGENLGIGTNHRYNENDANVAQFENLLVSVTQPASSVTQEDTSYVYTYVTTYGTGGNAITQESGPSPASPTVTIYINNDTNPATLSPVTVTIPAAPAGESITTYNLYRLVQQTDGSEVYEFVASVTSNTSTPVTYVDTLLDSQLGNALLTSTYEPPPSNLQGICALPNGVMAGFFDNTLCLSAQNFPFAWPTGNQYATDTQIVGIAPIDTTVLVLTTAHPYTAFGSDPSAYTMSKETTVQGCVSARSIATHKTAGVIYAAGNGLAYYRGQGQMDLMRTPEGVPWFTYSQWQSLNPSSIIGVVHDDRYFFWYDATAIGGSKGAYVVTVENQNGIFQIDVHVTSAYVDPATDHLWFTPDLSTYAVNGSVVTTAINVLSQWQGNSSALRQKVWMRSTILQPREIVVSLAQINANDFGSVALTVSNENGTASTGPVFSELPFVVAPVPGRRWQIQLSGTSTINTVVVCESADELAGGG